MVGYISPICSELAKIAAQGLTPNDKSELKQFLKNTGVIMAGTGAGIAAHELTRAGILKAFGPKGKWPGKISPRMASIAAAAAPLILGTGVAYGSSRVRSREKELREQARGRVVPKPRATL